MKQGYIFIAIATIMFSTFEVALKYIAGEINSVQLTFARFFIGFLFLAPLAWRTLKKRGLSLDRKAWPISPCWAWWASPSVCLFISCR